MQNKYVDFFGNLQIIFFTKKSFEICNSIIPWCKAPKFYFISFGANTEYYISDTKTFLRSGPLSNPRGGTPLLFQFGSPYIET